MRIQPRTIIINNFFEIMEDTRPPFVDIFQTHLLGHIHATFNDLIGTLGLPTHKGNGDQTRIEWHIATPQGAVTIYDWKEKDDIKDVNVWMIGGSSYGVLEYVEEAVGVSVVGGTLCRI
jgi:hypothetical protein